MVILKNLKINKNNQLVQEVGNSKILLLPRNKFNLDIEEKKIIKRQIL